MSVDITCIPLCSCSLNPAYEVSSAGSNHSVYASHLSKALERLPASPAQVATQTAKNVEFDDEGANTIAELVAGTARTGDVHQQLACIPSKSASNFRKLTVQEMLEEVAIGRELQ